MQLRFGRGRGRHAPTRQLCPRHEAARDLTSQKTFSLLQANKMITVKELHHFIGSGPGSCGKAESQTVRLRYRGCAVSRYAQPQDTKSWTDVMDSCISANWRLENRGQLASTMHGRSWQTPLGGK